MDQDRNKILAELYDLDESLKDYEGEIESLVDCLIKNKPETGFDEAFAQNLKRQILAEADSRAHKKHSFWDKFLFLRSAAFASFLMVIIALPVAYYLTDQYWYSFRTTKTKLEYDAGVQEKVNITSPEDTEDVPAADGEEIAPEIDPVFDADDAEVDMVPQENVNRKESWGDPEKNTVNQDAGPIPSSDDAKTRSVDSTPAPQDTAAGAIEMTEELNNESLGDNDTGLPANSEQDLPEASFFIEEQRVKEVPEADEAPNLKLMQSEPTTEIQDAMPAEAPLDSGAEDEVASDDGDFADSDESMLMEAMPMLPEDEGGVAEDLPEAEMMLKGGSDAMLNSTGLDTDDAIQGSGATLNEGAATDVD